MGDRRIGKIRLEIKWKGYYCNKFEPISKIKEDMKNEVGECLIGIKIYDIFW